VNGLHIHRLKKQYPEFTLSLDMEITHGSLTTLLGPSGCGKTTALSIITGIEEQDSGRIVLSGKDISELPPWKRNIGLVFQDYALFPHMNVYQNISYGLKIRGVSSSRIRSKVSGLMELIGLKGYEKRKPQQLSGGEQQRVALARALAPEPELLLLDEPLSALDAKLRIRLRGEIRRIQRELGVTTVYVTHDQDEALDISDEIAVMNQGSIEQTGTPEEIYRHPKSIFCGTFIGSSSLIPPIPGMHWRGYLHDGSPGASGEHILFFRPEDTLVEPPEDAGRLNLFRDAKLVRCSYRGFYYLYRFDWKGFPVTAHGSRPLEEGTVCTLGVSPDSSLLFES